MIVFLILNTRWAKLSLTLHTEFEMLCINGPTSDIPAFQLGKECAKRTIVPHILIGGDTDTNPQDLFGVCTGR